LIGQKFHQLIVELASCQGSAIDMTYAAPSQSFKAGGSTTAHLALAPALREDMRGATTHGKF
jgi:hypothetical protein